MIIKNCPFLLKYNDFRCEYKSILNKEGCRKFDNCPFKQVVEACQNCISCEWSRDSNVQMAKEILKVFEVENEKSQNV